MENVEIKILEFLKGLGTILLYLVVSILLGQIWGDWLYGDSVVLASVLQVLSYLILLLVLGLVYHKRMIRDFKNFKKEYVFVALKNWIIGIGAMIIANIIVSSLGGVATNEEANRSILSTYPISSVLTMVFIGPLVEELTFRAGFKKAFSKWYTFALVTALIFGTAHIQSFFSTHNIYELLYLIPYSTLGFFFAKAFYETDNIYTSYLAHMFHNGLCVLLLFVFSLIGG